MQSLNKIGLFLEDSQNLGQYQRISDYDSKENKSKAKSKIWAISEEEVGSVRKNITNFQIQIGEQSKKSKDLFKNLTKKIEAQFSKIERLKPNEKPHLITYMAFNKSLADQLESTYNQMIHAADQIHEKVTNYFIKIAKNEEDLECLFSSDEGAISDLLDDELQNMVGAPSGGVYIAMKKVKAVDLTSLVHGIQTNANKLIQEIANTNAMLKKSLCLLDQTIIDKEKAMADL